MRSINAAFAAAVAIVVGGLPAQAQELSQDCLRLEAEFAALGRPKQSDPRALQQSVARQQAELDRAQNQAKTMNCGRRFIFAPAPPAECGPLTDKIRQMQTSLDRLNAQASQAAQAPQDPRRRELLTALARGQCGPQYRMVERKVVTQPERKGFFEMLFGGGAGVAHEETIVEPEMDPEVAPRVSTFRTVCVRTCDGFFFPISFQTSRNAFERDEAICQATCPGTDAKLFAYPNPGGQMEQASSVDGEPYSKLQNAFRYRKEFVSGCSCKPEGMNWAEALSGVEDKTVKQGDIVVDETRAQEMSRPGAAQAQVRPGATPKAQRPPAQIAPSPQGANADTAPPGTLEEQRATGAAAGRARVNDARTPGDVIILDQNPASRGVVQRRALDGPDVERVPTQP